MRIRARTALGLLGGPAWLLALATTSGAQVVPNPPAPVPAPPVVAEPPVIVEPVVVEPVVEGQEVIVEETPADQRRQDRQFAEKMRNDEQPRRTTSRSDRPMRIAIDTDGDGTFDTVEAVYASALSRALQQSTERIRETRGLTIHRLSGTIQDLREITLTGADQPHSVARLASQEGRVAKVDLGPSDQLAPLKLSQGDRIDVVGHRGMINDRPVLMAVEVSKEQQSARIERPADGYMKRVRGEIQETRTAKFRGKDEPQVIAQVSLASGRQSSVILGPESKLQDVDLSPGTSAAMLVRPARLNGRQAMVAEQIRVGDRTISIQETVGRRPEIKTQQSSSSTQQKPGSSSEGKDKETLPALELDDSKP